MRVVYPPEALDIELPAAFTGYFTLSPYVTRAPAGYDMLLRLVNRDDDAAKKVSRVHGGKSLDGRSFTVDATAAIEPGPRGSDDDLGCEDPTIERESGAYTVFYSGYGGTKKRSTMLVARGESLSDLAKCGRAFDQPEFQNPKEAAVVATVDGFRMFFEYATNGASRIGEAHSQVLNGPWTLQPSQISERAGHFDAWHLSPACALRLADGTNILFYNGSTKSTAWRIGWAHLSADASVVLDRSTEPLISTFALQPEDTDIAFAASCVVDSPGEVSLYYSISDRRLYRQRLFVRGAVGDAGRA